jgi:hypothetical protein
MKEVARLLNDLLAAGVIEDYAVFGAVAQMRYTQAVTTLDADVLVGLPGASDLAVLTPIYEFCAARGWQPEGEAIRVGDWPVQFVPVFSPLTTAAMHEAEVGEVDGVPLRVVRADYLAVIALDAGRAKDMARILALLESGCATTDSVAALAGRHGLEEEWRRFRTRFLNE